jgi:uncharacterized membrane protein
LIGIAALILSAMFAGAALYINLAEHPARMALPAAQARAQWAPAYARGYVMQASLAMLSGVAGVVVWWRWGATAPLVGGLLMLANWPWTLVAIMPVNRALLTISDNGNDEKIGALLARWNMLHAVRTALGLMATACFAWPLIRF